MVASLILSSGAAAAKSRQPVQRPTGNAARAVIPFELVNRHVVLSVMVNESRPLKFLLDTGNRFAIIDLDRAKDLKLNLQGEKKAAGAGAEKIAGYYVQNSSFTIAGLQDFSQPITLAFPLKNLGSALGQDLDGLIGSDFIKEFVVEIDYQARLISLYHKEGFEYSGRGESIPVQLNRSGHPIIDAEVRPLGSDPIKGRFVLDIGSSSSLALYSPFVNQHKLLDANIKTIRALGGLGIGGEATGRVGRVAGLKIGNFNLPNPITFFSEDKEGAFATSEIQGNIGEELLSKFKVFLDYARNRVILEPNATFARPFDDAFSGLAILAEGKDYKTFRIKDVLENSPASAAGIQNDDVIVTIGGRPASALTLTQILDMLERPVPRKLIVRRAEHRLRFTLRPRKLV